MTTSLRMGLVGLNFGRHICNQLTTAPGLPVSLAKVCDLNTELAAERAAEFGVTVSPSLDALLTDPEIDVIGLYTGPNGRADLVRKIIRAGRDVMTTKPFEIDAEAALDVLREAAKLGRVVHLNSPNPRPFGEMAAISEWLAEGAIGTPVIAQASTWVYYGATPRDNTWYNDPVKCPVAPIFRLGIYPLNSLLTVFGEPETVQVTHARVETQRDTPDNASLTIGFRNGGIVNIVASFVVGGPDIYKNELAIGGTRGTIYFAEGPKPRDEGGQPMVTLSTDDRLEQRPIAAHAGEYDWDFFAQRVRGEVTEDVTTPEDVARAVRVVQAMSQAELTGQTVRVG